MFFNIHPNVVLNKALWRVVLYEFHKSVKSNTAAKYIQTI